MVHASIAERRRRAQSIQEDDGPSIGKSRSTSLIYDASIKNVIAAADHHMVAWPWSGDKNVALFAIGLMSLLNVVAIALSISLCVKTGECQ